MKRMQKHIPLGYHMVQGRIEVDGNNAEIVKMIFQDYVNGASINQIAKKMVELGVPNANGVPIWNHGPVGNILKNEQYLGTEFYPALIGTELFYKAQERRQQVSRELGRIAQPNRFDKQSILAGRLVCGICGQPYRRYIEHSNQYGKKVNWKCKHYIYNKRICCRNIFLIEEEIQNTFEELVSRLTLHPKIIQGNKPEKKVPYNIKIAKLNRQLIELGELPEYPADEMVRLIYERAKEQHKAATIYDWDYQTTKAEEALKARKTESGFDEELFRAIIRRIRIHPNNRLEFELINRMTYDISVGKGEEQCETVYQRNDSKKEHIYHTGESGI